MSDYVPPARVDAEPKPVAEGLSILSYRVPSGRETVAIAAGAERDARRSGLEAYAQPVTQHEFELWIVGVDHAEPFTFKGAEFVGYLERGSARAGHATEMERKTAEHLSRIARFRGDLSRMSPEAVAINRWWADV